MKKIKLLLIFGFFGLTINQAFASNLSLSVDGWNTKNVFYNESTTITTTTTFPENCTTTWITWTKSVPGFPFPTILTIWTDPTYTFSSTSNENFTVTANCDAQSVVSFVFVNIKNPEVSAGNNVQYNSGDTVNLSWNIIWTPCTVFDYTWEQVSWPAISINNTTQILVNSTSSVWANFIFPNTTDEIKIKLNVAPQSCYHAGNTYSGTVIYSINPWISSWRSSSSLLQEETELIFLDKKELVNKKIELNMNENPYFSQFSWSKIWWENYTQYELEYSTWSNFNNFKKYLTFQNNYNFMYHDLDFNSFVHYFRVKACFRDNCSWYSNIIKYNSWDYITINNYKNTFKNIAFDSILLDYQYLINKYLKTNNWSVIKK